MSSSPELRGPATAHPDGALGTVLTGADADLRPVTGAGRELRTGGWTRLGSGSVLGDTVTEHTLSGLAADAQAAARAQGYATGWAEGRRAAEERALDVQRELGERHRAEESRREAEHQAAVDALVQAAARFEDALATACDRVASHATELAVTLAEELVGHELAVAASPGVDAVRRALGLLPGEPVTRIHVSPAEAAHPDLAALAGAAVVVADPTLSRGDALVETAEAVIDARVSGAVQRVREVLLP